MRALHKMCAPFTSPFSRPLPSCERGLCHVFVLSSVLRTGADADPINWVFCRHVVSHGWISVWFKVFEAMGRLYGINCVQTLFYYQTYPDDNIYLKLLVCITSHTMRQSLVIWISHARWPSFGSIEWAFTPYAPIFHALCSRILETIQSGLIISSTNAYLIQGFGDVSGLCHLKWYVPFLHHFLSLLKLV